MEEWLAWYSEKTARRSSSGSPARRRREAPGRPASSGSERLRWPQDGGEEVDQGDGGGHRLAGGDVRPGHEQRNPVAPSNMTLFHHSPWSPSISPWSVL